MHEASIAESIIEIAEEHCSKAGCTRVETVRVDIGGASGVHPEALLKAFNIIKADSMASAASLIINRIPLGGTCRGCGRDFDTEEAFILQCPSCEGRELELKRGRELDIMEIQVE
jgi:hydrogenase nickel incorporation protein HypA/HybF